MSRLFRYSLPSALFALVMPAIAFADCAGENATDKKRHYQQALAFQAKADDWGAAQAFNRAVGYVCAGEKNTVEKDAAERAAEIGLRRGKKASQTKQLLNTESPQLSAYHWFELGGHFAMADDALINGLKQSAYDVRTVRMAIEHFDNRELTAFNSNNAAKIAATQAYRTDPKHSDLVRKIPGQQVERGFARLDKLLDPAFLQKKAELERKQLVLKPGDMAGAAKLQRESTAFHQRWSNDPLRAMQDGYSEVHAWIQLVRSPEREQLETRRLKHMNALGRSLMGNYSSSPDLMNEAMNYFRESQDEAMQKHIRQAALKEARKAESEQHYRLAASLYQLADEYELAEQADQKAGEQTEQASDAMVPSMAEMLELQKQFNDPEAIKAMQAQAMEMQKQIQAQQKAGKSSDQETDELADELGL